MRYNSFVFYVITALIAIATVGFGWYEYQREHDFRCDILHAQLQLNNIKAEKDSTIRLTVIDINGKVLSDSKEKDLSRLGNHLHRKEVQEALKTGEGYDIKRESETDGENYFYSATYFPDEKKIVRSAVPYSAPLTASLELDYTFIYYTLGILSLISIVLYMRYRLNISEEDKQRIKRQLTENAAHELKTPAATIEGYLETLVNNPSIPQEKAQDFIVKCYAQSKRMSRLLQDMSMLTKLDGQSLSPTLPRNVEGDSTDVSMVLRQIADETALKFEERGIALIMDIPERMLMKADTSLIYSLFSNIFDNTLAYASNATYFKVSAKAENGKLLLFKLQDNGVGVPEEHLPHLFERFYRIDKGRSRRLGGTGLGLAIVKNIALQYGGSATASATPHGGLTIDIELKN